MKAAEQARARTVGAASAPPSWKIRAASALVVAAVCAAHANSLHGPFIFDDDASILENPSIRHLGSLQVLEVRRITLPLVWLVIFRTLPPPSL